MQALSGQIQTSCVEEQAETVAPWDVTLRQISSGRFRGNLQFVRIGDMLIYRDCWSQRTLATGATPPGYLMIGGAAQPDQNDIDWCAAGIDEQHLALARPATEIEFIMPAKTPHLVLLAPLPCLMPLFGAEGADNLLPSNRHHYQCNPGQSRRFLNRLQWILNRYTRHPALLENPREQRAAEVCLLDDLAELGFGRSRDPRTVRSSNRRLTLRRAIDHGQTLSMRISVPEYAARIGVSQRTLELAFRESLGITPRQYLSQLRLHGVRAELRRREPGSHCVTEVASDWGFTELGRFAGDYRQLFGELPAATLAAAMPGRLTRLRDVLH